MKKIDPRDPITRSTDVIAENIERLKELFPEAFTEGKVDFDVLRQLLGDAVDDTEERYGLTWHGKRKARQLALTPSTGTLRPCPEESVDWDTTKNLMIEGDNLEVLKLLQRSYAGKVKLIYIDPPYNTGKDRIYRDDYHDSMRNYLEVTGQVEGTRRLSSHVETSGRFHTDWLNMLYPRLKLARQLLAPSGVLLISIDDREAHNIRAICEDVFGAMNSCGTFVWERKKKPSFLNHAMGTVTEYVIAYARDRPKSPPFVAGRSEIGKKTPFNNAGNAMATLEFPPGTVTFGFADGPVPKQDMSNGNIKTVLLDDITVVDGTNQQTMRLQGEWRYSQSTLDGFVSNGDMITISQIPFRPNYVSPHDNAKKTANLLSHRINGVPTNEDGTEELRALFGADVVSHPKPVGLLKYLVRSISGHDDIVMDFFAGSGTTGAAVINQNIEDHARRRYILVQLPELLDPTRAEQAGAARFCDELEAPRNMATLTKERLRRAGEETIRHKPGVGGDFGFRVFKLDTSNIRPWNPGTNDLDEDLLAAIDHIEPNRTEHDLLYELLLKLGLDLCAPIETRAICLNRVHAVGGGALFACLAPEIRGGGGGGGYEALATGIADWHAELGAAAETTVVFRDGAFADDVAKANVAAILEQRGLSDVRSL